MTPAREGPLPSVRRSLAVGASLLLLGFGTAAAQERAGQPAAGAAGSSAACPAPSAVTGDTREPLATVRYLADDALRGRLAGSPGAECAGRYVADAFRSLGLEPLGEDGGYFRSVPLESSLNPHAPGGTGRNVVGLLPGRGGAGEGDVVVLGAHYDHLGLGGYGSVQPDDRGQVHNGADDNASGVAALLEAARRLRREPRPEGSVVFVAFTGEELGLLGSSAYVRDPPVPLERTRTMINMDMVGRLGSDSLIVYGTGTAAEWEPMIRRAADQAGVPVVLGEEGFGPSDHTSFYAAGVPVLHFFTNVHGDYHRPSDDWQKVDAAGLERVAHLAAVMARRLADRAEPLTYREGAGRPPPSDDEGRGYGAYLGTVPDFAPVDRGVRISGVSSGSPAEKAGLKGGDVIVGLGDHEVEDLRGFTEALRAHTAGDTVEVRILRDGEERSLTAVLGSRSRRGR